MREAKPEAAAMMLRVHWGIGERPIRSMIHLLEAKGVRVFSLAETNREVDAYSFWRGDISYVFLNTQKSTEHSRFDAAHELGHLVLHKHASPNGVNAEKEANEFAGAFLMPKASVLASIPRRLDLPNMIGLKQRWTVSVAALARRLHDLNVLSEWQYRTISIEIQQRGYRTAEPNPARPETSQIWEKFFAALRLDGITRAHIARDLCVSDAELASLVFGLAVASVPSTAPAFLATPPRGNLRLVQPDE
jgi:Zn-dependent peptidase ImmA (M78 family)